MSPVALPYSILLLLMQFAIGGQVVVCALDLRGTAPRSFVRMGSILVAAAGALEVWVVLAVSPLSSLPGYALEAHFWEPLRRHSELFMVLAVAYAVSLFISGRRAEQVVGITATLAAVLVLLFISALVQPPAWSYLVTVGSLLSGGLALGGITLAMSLGHWYLVTPRLSEEPLNELILALLGVMLLQIVLLALNLAIAAHQPPTAAVIPLARNPGLWLRAGVGLVFAATLSFMAWRCSRGRDMMSATGLLYLATGAVLAGQALACSLIFSTAIPG